MSKRYFRYLLDRWKVALIFFSVLLILGVILSFGTFSRYEVNGSFETAFFHSLLKVSSTISLVITYLAPMALFHYVHRLKSADVYFSLPVSRQKMLSTSLFFGVLVSFWFFFLSALCGCVLVGRSMEISLLLKEAGVVLMGDLVLVCFNSLLFLLANNTLDGVIILGAYSLAPAFLNYVLYNILSASLPYTSAATEMISSRVSGYFSPVYMVYRGVSFLLGENAPSSRNASFWGYGIALLAFLALSLYGLHRHFTKRRTERAEHLSDQFFAYPFVISLYTIMALLILSFEVVGTRRSSSFARLILLVIFGVFTVAQFVYRRKIRLTVRSVLFFVLAAVLSFALSAVSVRTHGFGMGDRVPAISGDTITYFYQGGYAADLGAMPETYECTVEFTLEVKKDSPADREVTPILERFYAANAEAFYSQNNLEESWLRGSLDASGQQKDEWWSLKIQKEGLSLEDLKTISTYTEVYVYPSALFDDESAPVPLDEYLASLGR